ncbi:GL20561 [Drosophila persimilis]|uniref:GL20561 n=1 Tax=Drosophila persimilis TaxID=7234 RepID=B4GPF4_DROPE|nr:GL20561 [Drosophila persimilis]
MYLDTICICSCHTRRGTHANCFESNREKKEAPSEPHNWRPPTERRGAFSNCPADGANDCGALCYLLAARAHRPACLHSHSHSLSLFP